MSKISSNLLKKAFATWQHAFLSPGNAFYDILAQVCTRIKISRKWPKFLDFSVFLIFLFWPFLFLLYLSSGGSDWRSTGPVSSSKFWEGIIETGNFYYGVAKCSHGKFSPSFSLSKISEHFRAYLRLHWTDRSDRSLWSGYHWKDLFLLQILTRSFRSYNRAFKNTMNLDC